MRTMWIEKKVSLTQLVHQDVPQVCSEHYVSVLLLNRVAQNFRDDSIQLFCFRFDFLLKAESFNCDIDNMFRVTGSDRLVVSSHSSFFLVHQLKSLNNSNSLNYLI